MSLSRSLFAPVSFPASSDALIASPDFAVREQVLQRLRGRCRKVQHVMGGADALMKLERGECQVIFLDRALPDLDSGELVGVIQRRFPQIQVVLLDPKTEQVDQDSKPASEGPSSAGTDAEAEALPAMIGRSAAMRRVYRLVRLVAARNTTVLVTGPTGTGKELVARALHGLSSRAARPLVVVNCAAIPETLLESELFGYTRGAFTGAVQTQMGRIAAAQGGTLFLDEIGELPLGMQAKLLRFLEQKEVQKLGSAELTRVDVRVVAASNVDLARSVAARRFREDLFYRLAAFPIEMPPLAARVEDIIPLAKHFLACMAEALDGPCPRLSPEAGEMLERHAWPGNVRELQHVMERASILAQAEDTIGPEHLYFTHFGAGTEAVRHVP